MSNKAKSKLNKAISILVVVLVWSALMYKVIQYFLNDTEPTSSIQVVDLPEDISSSPLTTPTPSETSNTTVPTPTPVLTQNTAPEGYQGPVLPTSDFSGMDLFEDGMAEVKLDFGIDGDTAAFIVDGKSYHVRMLAIDTPEVDKNLRQLDPWGKAASSYTKSALANAHQIVLELDPDSDVFDKYGRLLAWVWVDGELHNYNVVEEGLAKVAYLYGDYLYTYEVQDAESMAKSQGIKIWGEKDPDYQY